MSNPNLTSEIDDWSVYRRLVVDTLKRLDERTAALHTQQQIDGNKISLIENRLKDLEEVERNIKSLSSKIHDINNERSTEKSVRKIFLSLGAALWSVVTILISAGLAFLIKIYSI